MDIIIQEVNYVAERKSITYEAEDLFSDINQFLSLFKENEYFSKFSIMIAINQKVKYINKKFEELIVIHQKLLNEDYKIEEMAVAQPRSGNKFALKPNLISTYHNIGEEIVFHIRLILDTLIQLVWVEFNKSDFEAIKKIEIDSIGKLLHKYDETSLIYKIFLGDDKQFELDKTNFLKITNKLFNSFKHSLLLTPERGNMYGAEYPTIVSLHAKQSNFKKNLIYHNHNAYHIMMGFQDTVKRVLKNLEVCKNVSRN